MYKDIINELMMRNKDDTVVLDFIEDKTNSFINYQAYVSFASMQMTRLRVEGLDINDYQHKVQTLDSRRRSLHDVAIGGVNALNRLCASHGIEPLMNDTSDRNKVGDFCFEISSEYFHTDRGEPLKRHISKEGHPILDLPKNLPTNEGAGMTV